MKRVHFAGWFTCRIFSGPYAGRRVTLCGRSVPLDDSLATTGNSDEVTCVACKRNSFIKNGSVPHDATRLAADKAMMMVSYSLNFPAGYR